MKNTRWWAVFGLLMLLAVARSASADDPGMGSQNPQPGHTYLTPPVVAKIDDLSFNMTTIPPGVRWFGKKKDVQGFIIARGEEARLRSLIRSLKSRTKAFQTTFYNSLTPELKNYIDGFEDATTLDALADDIGDRFNVFVMNNSIEGEKARPAKLSGLKDGLDPLSQLKSNYSSPTISSSLPQPVPGIVRGRYGPRTTARLEAAAEMVVPFEMALTVAAKLGISSEVTASVPQFTLSDNRLSLDLSAEPVFARRGGFDVAVQHEFTRYTLAGLYARVQAEAREAAGQDSEVSFKSAAKESNRLVQRVRVSALASYQDVGGSRVSAGGLSVGKLFALDGDTGPAVFINASAEFLHLEQVDHTSAIRVGFRAGWQDHKPFVDPLGKSVTRWKVQVGAEFVPHNVILRKDAAALFIRYRDEAPTKDGASWKYLQDHSTEWGLSAGASADGHAFVLLRVSRAFAF